MHASVSVKVITMQRKMVRSMTYDYQYFGALKNKCDFMPTSIFIESDACHIKNGASKVFLLV